MGLYNYAARDPSGDLTIDDYKAFAKANLRLYGGDASGTDYAFHGESYHVVVAEVSGANLYQRWIPPDGVRRIANKLKCYSPENLAALMKKDFPVDDEDVEEAKSLQIFFDICAQRGLGLIGKVE